MKVELEFIQSEIDKWSISDLFVTLYHFENLTVLGDADFPRNNIQRKELFRDEIDKRIQQVLKVKEL